MGFSISGLGSGIDTAGLVSQLMQAERAPQAKVTARQQAAQKQVTAWNDLRSRMQAVQTAAEAVRATGSALGSVATSSDATALRGTATSSASPGTFLVKVKALATAEQQTRTGLGPASMTVGAGRSYLAAGDLVSALDLTTADAGVHTVDVTRASSAPTAFGSPLLTGLPADLTVALDGGQPVSLTLQNDHADADALVQDVQDQLTARGLTVRASLVGGRLQISAASEGEDVQLQLGGAAATALGLPTTLLKGQDALVVVDGVSQTVSPVAAGGAVAREQLGDSGITLRVGERLRVGATRANVVVTSASSTLADLQTMLNATGSPVSAAVVAQGAGTTLVLSSTATGSAGAVSVTGAGTPVLTGLVRTPPTEAEVVLNGVTVTRSSNTLADIVPGLTLDLLHTPADGLERTVTVARDSGGTTDRAKALVDALNSLLTTVSTSTKYDVKGGGGGPLVGDGTARSLASSLFSTATTVPPSGTTAGLSQLGIETTREGRFVLKTDVLTKALASDPDGAAAVLGGFATSVADFAKGAGATGGLLTNRRDGAQSDADARRAQFDAMELRLGATEKRYKAQYAKLETAMASLTSQGGALKAALGGLTSTSR